MKTKALLDIETLDIKPNAVVLSAAFLIYDEDKLQTYDELLSQGEHITFDIQSQINDGRSISASTMNFWIGEGESAKVIFDGKSPPLHFMYMVELVVKRYFGIDDNVTLDRLNDGSLKILRKVPIQCRGQDFDFPITRSLTQDCGQPYPFRFSMARDLRTVYDENNFKYIQEENKCKPINFVKHHALHDITLDAYMLQRMRKRQMTPTEDLTLE